MGSVERGVARRGTGEVASMRAGLRMMGRVMGAPPAERGGQGLRDRWGLSQRWRPIWSRAQPAGAGRHW